MERLLARDPWQAAAAEAALAAGEPAPCAPALSPPCSTQNFFVMWLQLRLASGLAHFSKRPLVPSLRAAPAPGVQLLPQLGMSNELEEPEAEASEGGWEEALLNGAGEDSGEHGPEAATMEAELADEIEAQVSLVSSCPRRSAPGRTDAGASCGHGF